MDKEKLERFAANLVTERREIEEIVTWIEASPDHQKEFSRIKNQEIYAGFRNFDNLSGGAWKNNSLHPPVSRKTIGLRVLRYAAVFILAFLLGGFSLFMLRNNPDDGKTAFNEIIVPAGESSEVILADRTHVWLNSGARMRYPSNFRGKTREVNLIGEAFFEVSRDEEKPFHVVTPGLTVDVLGTSFNIEAFDQSSFTNVTLVAGKVKLENPQGDVLAVLSPHEKASYDTGTGEVEITKVNTSLYTSWKEGIIFFKDEKLGDIAKKIERWYSVKIVFDDIQVRDLKFTGSILKNKPVDQIMEILKYTSGVDYSIDIREQQPNMIHLKSMPMR
ncbi:MAG: FecR domain-containing protein [Prolixibacteraceae bacterium]